MRKVSSARFIPLLDYLASSITRISTKLKKMLMLKFVTSVLKLEEVTENRLSKLFPLDQLNPVHLSWSLLFILLSVFNLEK